jgi:hypothetical protein
LDQNRQRNWSPLNPASEYKEKTQEKRSTFEDRVGNPQKQLEAEDLAVQWKEQSCWEIPKQHSIPLIS